MDGVVRRLGDVIREHLDLTTLFDAARQAGPCAEVRPEPDGPSRLTDEPEPVRIGVFKDSAFTFYYPENLEALTRTGAKLVPISAIDAPAVTGAILMGSPAVPGNPLLQAAAEPWRNEAVAAVLKQVGRGARLDIATFFDFDTDYGYTGAT